MNSNQALALQYPDGVYFGQVRGNQNDLLSVHLKARIEASSHETHYRWFCEVGFKSPEGLLSEIDWESPRVGFLIDEARLRFDGVGLNQTTRISTTCKTYILERDLTELEIETLSYLRETTSQTSASS